MKIGLTISCYKRPQYLKQCLDYLRLSNLDGVTICIVDDGSDDMETLRLIDAFRLEYNNTCLCEYKISSKGIESSLLYGFEKLIYLGCDVIMNLDSDAIVKNNFITVLIGLHKKHSDTIVTGFNTLVPDYKTRKSRHPIVAWQEGYVSKFSIGGINMVMNKLVYEKYVKYELTKGYGWDWRVCQNIRKDNKLFVVSTPSVIQHIGINGDSTVNGKHNLNPDIAADF
jgi:glycosyltransferase involved in cell wall biosynthesis